MMTLLLAMQQADAAFPSGAFAFSNGIEGLAALPFPFDRAALQRHADAAIRHRWAGTDRVALIHAYRAQGDLARLAAIDQALEAATLAAPMRTGSQRAGRALLTTHGRLETLQAAALKAAIATGDLIGHLATIQGCLWQAIGLSEQEAVAISGYQTVSGLATAAVRLGRIGAIEAQAVVRAMLPVVEACSTPLAESHVLVFGGFVPFIEIAAMRAAAADLRLFAN
jgi:urease accessory protein